MPSLRGGAQRAVFTIFVSRDEEPCRYRVKGWTGMTALEALIEVYRACAPDLGFRYSCKTGRCLSCLVRMNGRSVVSCREPLVDGALIEPLANRQIIRDLAVDDASTRRYRPQAGDGLVPPGDRR
jgi:succinate dehydrogenase/fumarate reductase-like Fe-S protein